MFTLASQLPQNVGDEQRLALPQQQIHEQIVPEVNPKHSQARKDGQGDSATPEERVLTIGDRYQILLPVNDGGWIQGMDLYTNTSIQCHIHQTKRFLELSQMLSMNIEGIRQPQDIQGLGDQVAVLYPQTHGALHGHLKQKKNLSEVEAALYFKQIISIIDNSHKNGVVLRDLKLKKFVFLDEQRTTICLSDLEDAVQVAGHCIGGDLLDNRHGCPAYVAPEMLQPGSYSGRAADMWSAGVILYTLLVGHYPFYDPKAPNLFMKIRLGHYQIPDHVSYLARSLVCSLLSYDPALRPSAEGVACHPWIHAPPTHIEPLMYTYPKYHAEVDQTVPTHKLL